MPLDFYDSANSTAMGAGGIAGGADTPVKVVGKPNDGYSKPSWKNFLPATTQWAGMYTGWTKGAVDKVNSWVGRSRPLTAGGATADVGTHGNRAFDTNVQAASFAQKNFGGTFADGTSMLGVHDWLAPHTEPVNNVIVDQEAHSPVAVDFNSRYTPNRVFR